MAPSQAIDVMGRQTEEQLLQEALQMVERARSRALFAEREMLRCREAAMGLKGSVRVMARVRPPHEMDDDEGSVDDWLRIQSNTQLEISVSDCVSAAMSSQRRRRASISSGFVLNESFCESRSLDFERVFTAEDDETVFESFRNDVNAAFEGEAVCIVAYGASGSGKSFFLDQFADWVANELELHVQSLADEASEQTNYKVSVQMYELLGDQTRDLLTTGLGTEKACLNSPSASPFRIPTPLTNTADRRPRISISGPSAASAAAAAVAVWQPCGHEDGNGITDDLRRWLCEGRSRRRHSENVYANDDAAGVNRSHVITTFAINTLDAQTGEWKAAARITLADLAASDRLASRNSLAPSSPGGPQGLELGKEVREAQIARSLSSLADVIQARESGRSLVPYRSSKLTHLLQEALGGCQDRCRTIVVLALDPSFDAQTETLRTLQFGSRLCTSSHAPGTGPRRKSIALNASIQTGEEAEDGFEELDDDDLRAEILKLKIGTEEARCKCSEFMKDIDEKEKRIQELECHSASLETAQLQREKLLGGLMAVHRRIEDAEATAARSLSRSRAPSPVCERFSLPSRGYSIPATTTVTRRGPSAQPSAPSVGATRAAYGRSPSTGQVNSRAPQVAQNKPRSNVRYRSGSPPAPGQSSRPQAPMRQWRQAVSPPRPPPSLMKAVPSTSSSSSRPVPRSNPKPQPKFQPAPRGASRPAATSPKAPVSRPAAISPPRVPARTASATKPTGNTQAATSVTSNSCAPWPRRLGPPSSIVPRRVVKFEAPSASPRNTLRSRAQASPERVLSPRSDRSLSSDGSSCHSCGSWFEKRHGHTQRFDGSNPQFQLLPLKLDLSRVFADLAGGPSTAALTSRTGVCTVPSTPRGRPSVVWWDPQAQESQVTAPASARRHAPVVAPPSRRRQTSREYVLEVITPRTAKLVGAPVRTTVPQEENDAGSQKEAKGLASSDEALSPAMLLRPPHDDEEGSDDDFDDRPAFTTRTVSTSSDEGDIRQRLQEELSKRGTLTATDTHEEEVVEVKNQDVRLNSILTTSIPTPSRSPRQSTTPRG